MDAARAAVSKITSRKGHTTDVDEYVNPAVVSEVIKPHRHEVTQEAIDREIHQDHYHTTVQPIAHKEVLPEQHKHNIVPQIEREFRHDNEHDTKDRVARELGQFQNTSTVVQGTQSSSAAQQVAGEHVHHHVHETVQPVIHKETIQPEVVHTTIPIHEIHHGSAEHHGLSALPMKTLDEFKAAGGVLSGSKQHTHEEYEGAPRPYNEKLSTTLEKVLPGHHGAGAGMAGAGVGAGVGAGMMGRRRAHRDGRERRDSSSSSSSSSSDDGRGGRMSRSKKHGLPSRKQNRASRGIGSGAGTGIGSGVGSGRNTGNYGSSTTGNQYGEQGQNYGQQQGQKPSLMDKLNPRKDANNDGQPGFMK